MTNNLRQISKDLRAFAKRTKDFKYTDSALIIFLMTGMVSITTNLFPATTTTSKSIETQKQEISSSIKGLHQKVKETRRENEKLLKDTNLELVKLMEQGDHVVKSPWSSWQFGMNYIYNDWHGRYKGRGDKLDDTIYQRDKTMAKYKYNSNPQLSYGNTTQLGRPIEPNAAIPVSASLTPLVPKIKQANLSLGVDISDLPSFEPRNVSAPSAPSIASLSPINSPSFSLNSQSIGNGGEVVYDYSGPSLTTTITTPSGITVEGGQGVIESVAILSGNFLTKRTGDIGSGGHGIWEYSYGDYKVKNAFNANEMFSNRTGSNVFDLGINGLLGPLSRPTTTTNAKTGFMRMVSGNGGGGPDTYGATMLNHGNFMYTQNGNTNNYVRELVHLDMHGTKPFSDQDSGLTSALGGEYASGKPVYDAFADMKSIANATTGSGTSQTFINDGNVIIEGSNSSFSNSYDHTDPENGKGVGAVLNTKNGNIIIHPSVEAGDKNSAVFIVSPEIWKTGNPQILYNAGNIKVYNENSAVFFLNPDGDVRWNSSGHSINGKYFQNSEASDTVNPREITIVNRANGNNELSTYGKNNVGVYLKTSKYIKQANLDFKTKNSGGDWAPMKMYGDKSIGLYGPEDTTSINNSTVGPVNGNFAVSIGNDGALADNKITTYASTKNANTSFAPTEFTTAGTPGSFPINNDKYTDQAYGIYSLIPIDFEKDTAGIGTGKKDIENGHEITLNQYSKNSIGVLPGNSTSIKLGKGKIALKGGIDNVGIVSGGSGSKNTYGTVKGDVITLQGASDTSDRGNRAIYTNKSGNNVTVNAVKSTDTTNSIALVADDHSTITVNKTASTPTILGTGDEPGVSISGARYEYDNKRTVSASDKTSIDNVGAAYSNNGATITIDRNKVATNPNITITGGIDTGSTPEKYVGFGLYANNGGTISAKNNNLKLVDTAVGIASTNSTSSDVNLEGSTVDYSGNGYALYSDGKGKIELTNGHLKLGGKSTGFSIDAAIPSGSQPVQLGTSTDIDVYSDDVILMNVHNFGTNGLHTLNIGNTLLGFIGGSTSMLTTTSANYKYKYAVVDGEKLVVDSPIDKADTTAGSDSEVFTRRLLAQNSQIEINDTVKAELNTTQLAGIDKSLTVPVGFAVSASSNTKNTTTTGITNNSTVSSDRTDGTDKGGIGLFVNYGYIKNNAAGVVNIEKGTTNGPNKQGIGIYATNSTDVTNAGQVNAGGEKSIGILGLSYRLDSKTGLAVDPVTETYYTSVNKASGTGTFGKVNVVNDTTGKITMDNDGAVGIFVKNNSIDKDGSGNFVVTAPVDRKTKSDIKAVNKGEITINGSNNSVAMGANNGIITNDTTGKINVNGIKSAGMYGTKESDLINNGEINVAATSAGNESIGMYIDDQNSTIKTSGKINVNDYSYGIFGKKVDMTGGEINIKDGGVGIYSTGPTVNITSGKIKVGDNNAVGVYIADDKSTPQPTTVTGNAEISVGDTDSFGYLITAVNAKTDLTTNAPTAAHVGEKSVYIYSAAPKSLGGKIINHTGITTDKNNGYGIYSSQDADNYGNINLTSGNGNIGMYSTQGVGRNYGTIEVGKTDTSTAEYGIGMATGYYNKGTGSVSNEGTIENHGTINVTKENSVGMYAVGSGSKAINAATGVINLSAAGSSGMFIDQGATGINYGIIQTTPTADNKGIKGVVVINNGILKNYGTIAVSGNKNMGVYRDGTGQTSSDAQDVDPATGQHGKNTSTQQMFVGTPTDQKVTGKVVVKIPPASAPNPVSIAIDGVQLTPAGVDTNIPEPNAPEVKITDVSGATTLNLATEHMDHTHSNGEISSIGMYVDTSGINYTKPIQGIEHLHGLTDIDLIIGTEAARYLNSRAIQIGDNILKPYNDELGKVVTTGVTLNVNSASLTWIAQPVQSGVMSSPIKTVYLVKIPYTDFASPNDPDTAHFLDGLEQRYGVEGIHSREKQLFNKLNDLGKGEAHIFTQAVNEMKGYEYSNTQQRINATGNALDKEFSYLKHDWRNPSKQNNKIKAFGQRDEYNTDTAGIIDYKSNAYGVAYVHEDEKIKMGNSQGWYAGVVTNRFRFKDLGHSKEDQTMVKAGIFKTMSPKRDYNGALQWTIGGDVFTGRNSMKRRYWVVDDTFEAKSDYWTYGAALKTDLGYDIRMSERTHLRPYGALKMEYGRFNKIKEDSGEMRLEVKDNSYFSVRPEVGMEFKYVQPLAVRTNLSVGLSAAYENELGKLNRLNQAKVRYTSADWYNLRNEKEDRRGNGKFDLNIGVDNTRFGVTVNGGYDTKGNNVRGGIGFRAIY